MIQNVLFQMSNLPVLANQDDYAYFQTPWPSLLLMQLKLDVSSNNRSSPTNVHISGRIYGEISHNLSASPDIELEFSTLFITSGSFFQQEPTCTYITYILDACDLNLKYRHRNL